MQRREFFIKTGKTLGVGTLAFSTLSFEACNTPQWVITAESIAADILPIAGSIVDVIVPTLAPLVAVVNAGFSAVLKALQDFQASPTAGFLSTLRAAFAALNANVANLLNAFNVSSSKKDAVIVGIIGLITQAVANLANLFPAAVAESSRRAFIAHYLPAANTWKGKDFYRQYDIITNGDQRFKKL